MAAGKIVTKYPSPGMNMMSVMGSLIHNYPDSVAAGKIVTKYPSPGMNMMSVMGSLIHNYPDSVAAGKIVTKYPSLRYDLPIARELTLFWRSKIF